MAQKATRMGKKAKRKSTIVVMRPPPTFHARYVGTATSREMRSTLEKLTLPGPSAGSGGLWMARDCE